jgi:hypothetical protein
MTARKGRVGRVGLRGLLGILFAGLLAMVLAAPASAYNGENKLHVRLQSEHTDCGDPATLTATVTDKEGDAQSGVLVSFTKQKSYPGETLAPTSDVTNANGQAESSYTIPCGSKPGARVIKACEPAGGCGTTVVLCQRRDGCTAPGRANTGAILASAASRDSATATTSRDPAMQPTSATLPPVLNVLTIGLFALMVAGAIRGRPKSHRAATPA